MKTTLNKPKPYYFLIVGVLAISMTHMSFSVDFLAWFSNVPFLLYLYLTKGWKARLIFVFALIVAWSVVVLKIVTPPIPYAMIFLFSLPISLIHLPAYLIWDRNKSYKWAFLLFPAILTVSEWIQYSFTPFASWGVMAYSQLHSNNIMQLVSVFGIAGLSFLIYWINISIAQIILSKKISFHSFYLPCSLLLIVTIFGTLRIDIGKSRGHKTLTIATIGTTSGVSGLPLPSKESNDKVIDGLFEKTKEAGSSGAKIIVWNEAAFYTLPQDERTVVDSIIARAKEYGISIVASYVMPVSENPFRYENKLLFINPRGEVEYSYLKHQPVPGEPAIQGKETFKTVQIASSTVGAAICYDYDFPYIAGEYGKLKTDIVVVPSSDWRGIDPLHTRMAAYRAIEQGHSVIRSTRFGLSAAISPFGEMISQSSSFDENSRIMIADIPSNGFETIYSNIGDVFIFLCIGFIIIISFQIVIEPATKSYKNMASFWRENKKTTHNIL